MPGIKRYCALIFVLALAVRLTMLFPFHMYQVDRSEAVRTAISLARSGDFADPYVLPTGHTAHNPPLYPALIAPLYALWGDTLAADRARFALNAIAASVQYAMLPAIAIALGLGFWPGVLAGFGGALIPLHYWPESMGDFENTFSGLFLELMFWQFLRFLQAPSAEWRRAVKAGFLFGTGPLLAPTVAPVLAGFVAIGYTRLRPPRKTAICWLVILAAATLATLTPWLARNYLQLGALSFIRDDFGLELFVSNHDGATPVAERNYVKPYWIAVHPHYSTAAALEVRRGESEFERRMLSEAIAWIHAHPRQFVSLTVSRTIDFWFAVVPRFGWMLWVVTVLAAIGWLLLLRESAFAAICLGSVLLGYSAVFSLIETTVRYQHPIWWVLLLLTGWAVYVPLRRWPVLHRLFLPRSLPLDRPVGVGAFVD
jgi:hypothetical protein